MRGERGRNRNEGFGWLGSVSIFKEEDEDVVAFRGASERASIVYWVCHTSLR